jgi:hypothetical protein
LKQRTYNSDRIRQLNTWVHLLIIDFNMADGSGPLSDGNFITLTDAIENKSDSKMRDASETSIAVEKHTDVDQKGLGSEMDRVRREKQIQVRGPELSVPNSVEIKPDVDDVKVDQVKDIKPSENAELVETEKKVVTHNSENGTLEPKSGAEVKPSESIPITNGKSSIKPSTAANTNSTNEATSTSTPKQYKLPDGPVYSKEETPSINIDDATLAYRMWNHLRQVEMDLDDGRRSWVNAYSAVKKQADELVRKKQALEDWRDELDKLREQLPLMEAKLTAEADKLYQRRNQFDQQQKDLHSQRKEFSRLKTAFSDWCRMDDREYDHMLRSKSGKRRGVPGPHPPHPHHHIMPSGSHPHSGGIYIHNDGWGANGSPLSTPESHLDDYSNDGAGPPPPNIDADLDSWGVPKMGGMPPPPPGIIGQHLSDQAGASSTSMKKDKQKAGKKSGVPSPPPLPESEGSSVAAETAAAETKESGNETTESGGNSVSI